MIETEQNFAETIAMEARKPLQLDFTKPMVAVPAGYVLQDLESCQEKPRRKRANLLMNDCGSFIEYAKRQGSLASSAIYCAIDYANTEVKFYGVLNDFGDEPAETAWRDHIARFRPEFSEEWERWVSHDQKHFSQTDIAHFLEENSRNIASVENMPTGAQMLEMVLDFEAKQDMRFKSAIRLQNGAVEMCFVQNDDNETLAKMKMFERFSIGIPVFWNGDAYQLDARLKYRVNNGKVVFWYEIIRKDKVFEAATESLITTIKEKTGMQFYFGNPFAERYAD